MIGRNIACTALSVRRNMRILIMEINLKQCVVFGCSTVNRNPFHLCDHHAAKFEQKMRKKHPDFVKRVMDMKNEKEERGD